MDPTTTNGLDDVAHADMFSPNSHTQDPSQRRSSQSSSTLEARRIRKRELDRHAQRSARQRTKDRIAFLEACLEASYQTEPSVRVVALLEELAAVKKQRDELIQVVSSIQKTLQGGLPSSIETKHTHSPVSTGHVPASTLENGLATAIVSLQSGPPDPISSRHHSVSVNNSFADHRRAPVMSGPNSHECVPANEPFSMEARPPYDISALDYQINEIEPIVPPPQEPCHCMVPNQSAATPSSEPLNIWRSVNKVLSRRESVFRSTFAKDTAYDGDIPVRVVLEGWDSVEQTGLLTPAWKKLRAVDELCFTSCDPVARLAIIHTMYLFLRWDTNPSPENLQDLPKWYLRRPSQDIAHSMAIDYFVWPGVREKFVFSQHRYCSNRFWQIFSRNLRILWTQGLQKCYSLDFVTGRHYITPEFKSQIRDLRCWTMVEDFFADFPDLSCDIPSYEEIPRALPVIDARSLASTENEHRGRRESIQHNPMLTIDDLHISAIPIENEEFWQAGEISGCNLQDFLCGN